MENEDDQQQQQRPNREVKLPPFWPTNPAAWFAAVEGKFFLRGVDDKRAPFYNCLQALP